MYIPGCGVIGNTTDFGSVISGSSPDSLTPKAFGKFKYFHSIQIPVVRENSRDFKKIIH